MLNQSYQDVIQFYKPIEHFICLLYPTLEESIHNDIGYFGNAKLPAKISSSKYSVYAVIHEFAHIIEWSMAKIKDV